MHAQLSGTRPTGSRRSIRLAALTLLLMAGMAAPALAQDTEVQQRYQASYDAEAMGQYQTAVDELEALPRAVHSTYVYQLRQAWLLYLLGRYDDAIDAYNEAAETEPDALEPLVGLMLPQMAQRQWQDAEQTARAILAIDSFNLLTNRRLALTLYNLGQYDEAEEVYREVLRYNPSDVEMKSGLGWCRFQLGDTNGAAEIFRDVLEVSPRQYSAIQGLAATE